MTCKEKSIPIYLWWFEGATSWIGDIMCLRSGAWSAEDYFADMKRKLKRHHTRSDRPAKHFVKRVMKHGFTSIEAMPTQRNSNFILS